MVGFLVFVAIIVGVVILVRKIRKNKREEAVQEVKVLGGVGYEIAKNIQDELTKNGYEVSEGSEVNLDIMGRVDYCVVTFSIRKENESGYESGEMKVGRNYHLERTCNFIVNYNLMETATSTTGELKYGIWNYNIGLIIHSWGKSRKIEPFLEIAAKVIKNSGYEFEHPECISKNPETKKYLNVIFQ